MLETVHKNSSAMYVDEMRAHLIPGNQKPVTHPHGGCRTCHFWGGWTALRTMPNGYVVTLIGATALCLRTKRVDAQSVIGCDRWQRETGTDDYL